jgi:hypothetical protein
VVLVAVAAFTGTVFAIGLVAQLMNRIKFLSIGLVGIMALIHDRIMGLILSAAWVTAWVTKNRSGTAQSTGRHPNVGGVCRSDRIPHTSANPAEHEHRRKRAVLCRTNGFGDGPSRPEIVRVRTINNVSRETLSVLALLALGFWSGIDSTDLSRDQFRGSIASAGMGSAFLLFC